MKNNGREKAQKAHNIFIFATFEPFGGWMQF